MKFINISKKTAYIFEELDPFFMLSFVEETGNLAIGAMESNEEGYDYPVGLAVCKRYGERMVILWLFVNPEYRLHGIGDALLGKVKDLSQAIRVKSIAAYFNTSADREMLCPNSAQYFIEHGFTNKLPLCGEWLTDVRTLLNQPYFSNCENTSVAMSFSKIPKSKRFAMVHAIMKKLGRDSIEELAINYEPDLSFVIADKNGSSAIIVNKMDEMLTPICFYAKDESCERELMYSFLQAAKEKYGKKIAVRVVVASKDFATTMNKIYAKGRYDSFVLLAEMESLSEEAYNVGYVNEFPEIVEDKEIDTSIQLENYLKSGEDIIITLDDMHKTSIFAGKMDCKEVVNIGKMNLLEFNQFILDAVNNKDEGVLKEIPAGINWFDPDISCFIEKDGKPVCFLVTAVTKNKELRPLMIFSKGNENSKYLVLLLQYTFNKAMELYSGDMKVLLRNHSERAYALYSKILNYNP